MVLAIAAVWVLGQFNDPAATRAMELRLSKWKPTKEDRETPPIEVWEKKANITGTWSTMPDFAVSSFKIKAAGNNRYEVTYDTGGCTSSYTLQRTGVFTNGVLVLNKPVQDGQPFDRLYPVMVKGEIRLLSPRAIREVAVSIAYQKGNGLGWLCYSKYAHPSGSVPTGLIEIEIAKPKKPKG